jgi:hypothetical protein
MGAGNEIKAPGAREIFPMTTEKIPELHLAC